MKAKPAWNSTLALGRLVGRCRVPLFVWSNGCPRSTGGERGGSHLVLASSYLQALHAWGITDVRPNLKHRGIAPQFIYWVHNNTWKGWHGHLKTVASAVVSYWIKSIACVISCLSSRAPAYWQGFGVWHCHKLVRTFIIPFAHIHGVYAHIQIAKLEEQFISNITK